MPVFDAGSVIASADLDRTPFITALRELQREGDRFSRRRFTATADVDERDARRRIDQLKRELASIGNASVSVNLSDDASAQARAIRQQLSGLDNQQIGMSVELRGAPLVIQQMRTIAQQARALSTMRAVVTVDTNGASDTLAQLQAVRAAAQGLNGQTARVNVRADNGQALRSLTQVRTFAFTLDRTNIFIRAHVDIDTARMAFAASQLLNLKMAAVALGPALIPLGAAALAAGASFASMATLAGAAAGIFGGALFGLVKASQDNKKALDDSSAALATAKSQYASTASAIKSAEKGIVSAKTSYTNAVKAQKQAIESVAEAERGLKDAQQGVRDAQESLTEAREQAKDSLYGVKEAQDKVRDAEEDVRAAQEKAQDAQKDLNQARKDATQDLKDMRLELSGSMLDEESAILRVKRSKEELDKAMSDPKASKLDRAEKMLAHKEAVQRLTEVMNRNQELKNKVAQADREGVEGSEKVKAAKQRVADATRGITDAERKYQDAQRGVVKAQQDVAKANRGVAEAERGVAQARDGVAAASRRIKDAQAGVAAADAQVAEAKRGIAEAHEQLRAAQQRQADAANKVAEAQNKVNEATKRYTPMQKAVTGAIDGVKAKWADFIKATEGATGPVLIKFLNAVGSSFRHLVPVVRAVAPVANEVVTIFRRWIDTKLDGWVNYIIRFGVPALRNLMNMGRSVGGVFGRMVKDFAPWGLELSRMLARGAAELKKWADGGGFRRFMQYVLSNKEQIKSFFKALGGAFMQVARAARDMGPAALGFTTVILRIISRMPPALIQAFAYAWILWKVAVAAHNVVLAIHAGLLVTIRGRTIAHIAILAAYRAMTFLVRAATLAWAAAQWILNVALTANPIGLIVLGIAALGAAIVWIALKTTWFQTAWKAVWGGIKVVFNAVVGFIKEHWKGLVTAFLLFLGPAGWLAAAALNWEKVWGFIKDVGAAAWGFLRGRVLNPLRNFFTQTLPDAAAWLLNRIQTRWNQIQQTMHGVFAWSRRWIFNPIINFFTELIPDAAAALFRRVRDRFEDVRVAFRDKYTWMRDKTWNPMIRFFTRTIPDAAMFLFRKVRDRVENVRTTFRDKYTWIRDKVFVPLNKFFTKTIPDAAGNMARKVRDAFKNAAKWIGQQWTKIKSIVAKPVNFVIDTVYNKGIKRLWDKVADVIFGKGKKHLPTVKPIKYAKGGEVPHTAPGAQRGKDSVSALVMPGEHILSTADVDAMGGQKAVYNFRAGLHNRKAISNDAEKSGMYALGGAIPNFDIPNPIDVVKKTTKKVAGAIAGVGKKVWDKMGDLVRGGIGIVANPILDGIKGTIKKGIGSSTGWKQMVSGIATKPINWIKDLIAGDDSKNSGLGAGFSPWAPWKDGDGFRVMRDGKWLNKRTAAMFDSAQKAAGINFNISQGSYNAGGVTASAGTHDGGGVLDLTPSNNKLVGIMRSKGFAAWGRTPSEGFSSHIHAVAVGDPTVSAGAAAQVKAFFAGKNGLADNGPDTYVPPGGGKGSSVGNLTGIVAAVLKELRESPSNLANVIKAINKESGGNPMAINNWDINARKGTPSKGLLQVIDPTFNAYAGPYRNRSIYDPYANIYAAVNYARKTYGQNWSSRMARPGGYFEGIMNAASGVHGVAEKGAELVLSPGMRHFKGGERVLNARDTRNVLGGGTVKVDMPDRIVVQVDGQQFNAYVDVQSRKTLEAVFSEAERSRV